MIRSAASSFALVLLSACTAAPSRPPTASASDVPTVVQPGPASADASFPAEVDTYYVGVIPGADPRVAYSPGSMRVLRRPDRLRFQGAPEDFSGPATTSRSPNYHPDPTAVELDAALSSSTKIIASLAEKNAELAARLQAVESAAVASVPDSSLPAPDPAAVAPAPGMPAIAGQAGNPELAVASSSPAPVPSLDGFQIVKPNAANVVEFDPAYFVAPASTSDNPFVQLFQPPITLRELTVVVSAAMPGPQPTAMIDQQLLKMGDNHLDFEIYRIDPDTVYLRKERFLIACPVSAKPLRLHVL